MTGSLQDAFKKAEKLPESEQERFGRWLLVELESDQRWDQALAASPTTLERLADEARAEHRRGETEVLDADQL